MTFSVIQQAHPSQKRNLLSLNTEVILLLLNKCLAVDLIAISQTSRRLHYIAMSLYLTRFGVKNGLQAKEVHLEGRCMHALHGLQSSLAIPGLDRLSVKFNDGIYFAQEIRHLISFISRSACIREVTLHFANIDSRWVNGLISVSSATWRSDLLKLLSILVERKCEVLNVRLGYFLTYETLITAEQDAAVIPKSRAFIDRQISAVSSLLGVSFTGVKRRLVVQKPTSMDLQDRSLRTFRLHCNIFFTHTFYSWMMEMFRKTPLTSLSLQALGVMEEEWTAFLRSLTIPTLTHVAFISSHILFQEILTFVSRHPYLTSVDLHPYYQCFVGKGLSKRWKFALPGLDSIGGSPANVKLFLGRIQPTPAIQHFSLSLPVHQRPFGLGDFELVDKMILTAVKNYHPHTLTLEFVVPVISDELSYEASSGSGDSGASAAIYAHRRVFPSVETIRFSSDESFAFSKWILPLLPLWLATFPALKQVSLATSCLPQGADRQQFVEAIQEACPGVDNVLVDDNECVRKVAYWL
ncbi:hypothetical protein APHAL10511_003751 [Amanita phalloides]|nr:hypothetical protein APHAL10511_003751 [Amanita phalloides]